MSLQPDKAGQDRKPAPALWLKILVIGGCFSLCLGVLGWMIFTGSG